MGSQGDGWSAGVLPATPTGRPWPSGLSEAPGGRGRRGGSSAPGTRAETPDPLPPLGFGAGAGLGEEGECPDGPGGAGTGLRNGVREPGKPGRRGKASGARRPRVWAGGWPARGARRPGVESARARSCHWRCGAVGALVAPLKIPSYQIIRPSDFPVAKIPFLGRESGRREEERKKKGRGRLLMKHYNSQVCSLADISGNFYVTGVVLSGVQPII